MRNEMLGVLMLVVTFGLGYLFGLRHANWRLREATKRIDHAIDIIRRK